ncbi:MAG: hypothetical protein AAFP70_12750, partial [Calditrichota bacterium]
MKMRDRMKFFMLTAFVAAVLALAGCSEDSTTEPQPSENKSTGFVVNVQTPSLSHFVQFFETLPTGTVDISSGKDFQRFFPVDIYDGAFFMANPNEEQEFSKVVVNADGEVVVESGFTVGTDAPFQIAIRDSAFGVFHDRSTSQVIGTFDPRTMTKTGNIDMGAGQLPGTGASRYQSFYFKENFLYAPVRPEVGGNYDSLGIHVADLSSGTYVKTILFSTKGSPSNDFGQNDLDEAGNLYIPDSGNPLIFPPAPAVLNRINAGSTDIDPTYVFPLGFVLNQTNIFPTFGG